MPRYLILLCSLTCPVFAAADGPAVPADAVGTANVAASPASLLANLQALSAASVCQSASDCHSVAIGARACGGPESYLAFSSDQLKAARAQAARHAQWRKDEHARRPEEQSDCRMVADPGATCPAGRCVPGSGAGARGDVRDNARTD